MGEKGEVIWEDWMSSNKPLNDFSKDKGEEKKIGENEEEKNAEVKNAEEK